MQKIREVLRLAAENAAKLRMTSAFYFLQSALLRNHELWCELQNAHRETRAAPRQVARGKNSRAPFACSGQDGGRYETQFDCEFKSARLNHMAASTNGKGDGKGKSARPNGGSAVANSSAKAVVRCPRKRRTLLSRGFGKRKKVTSI